jgi:hypothetical protein
MKIYSYVVRYDDGVAPNPFWGYCTLAICKPRIRRVAKVGDWVVGTGSKENVGNDRLIYVMRVTEVMRLEEYGNSKRFRRKIPEGKRGRASLGDNIYYVDKDGVTKQRFPSVHSHPDRENITSKRHDLSGRNVLISESGDFYYFGRNAPKIPASLSCLVKKSQGHKCNFSQDIIDRFLSWIREKDCGISGYPCGYSDQRNFHKKCKPKFCE